MIEINADIQPGDSGGSLVNSSGQVIGIDTAASTSQFDSATNQGYAIPINTALSIANQIVGGQGSSTVHIGKTAFLGVGVLAAGSGSGSGAQIDDVLSGSAAAAAGLVKGDTITALGGQAINSPDGLTDAIELHHPGDQVQITWVTASGQAQTGTVTFANGPAA
jgi:S1-C subfamily serine protease